ncbi:MAG: hypothetical protein AB7G06_08680 [Bdellovibrionales bacterium]
MHKKAVTHSAFMLARILLARWTYVRVRASGARAARWLIASVIAGLLAAFWALLFAYLAFVHFGMLPVVAAALVAGVTLAGTLCFLFLAKTNAADTEKHLGSMQDATAISKIARSFIRGFGKID